ncbi:MAG: hypothetical protein HY905_26150 [Deltaproteobacteria bacterium]|nr:hypothetical protein [Deltaproteobacteria bacterium]
MRTLLECLLLAAAAGACGEGAEGSCPGGCPACWTCVGGLCISSGDCDGGTDGDGTEEADEEADADAEEEGDGREDGEGDADSEEEDGDGGPICGTWPGGACGAGLACDIAECWPGAPGVCVEAPSACDETWGPVCGCDGITYFNACARLSAGVALDQDGECASPTPGAPLCTPSGTAWYSDERAPICDATCAGCRAECREIGTLDEGWYAVCGGAADGGCGWPLPDHLIAWAACG